MKSSSFFPFTRKTFSSYQRNEQTDVHKVLFFFAELRFDKRNRGRSFVRVCFCIPYANSGDRVYVKRYDSNLAKCLSL